MFALRLSSLFLLVGRPNPLRAPAGAASVAAGVAVAARVAAEAAAEAAAVAQAAATAPSLVPAGATPRVLPDRAVGSASRSSMTGPEPEGIRVVPLRPESAWPRGRARQRVLNPFRAFPNRSVHLVRMMAPAEPND